MLVFLVVPTRVHSMASESEEAPRVDVEGLTFDVEGRELESEIGERLGGVSCVDDWEGFCPNVMAESILTVHLYLGLEAAMKSFVVSCRPLISIEVQDWKI